MRKTVNRWRYLEEVIKEGKPFLNIDVPVVSGSMIGLDNTCQSGMALKSFFFGHSRRKVNSIYHEISLYKEEKKTTIVNLIREFVKSKNSLNDLRLQHNLYNQAKQYEQALKIFIDTKITEGEIVRSWREKYINMNFSSIPPQFEAIINSETNIAAIKLAPKKRHNYLRFSNCYLCTFGSNSTPPSSKDFGGHLREWFANNIDRISRQTDKTESQTWKDNLLIALKKKLDGLRFEQPIQDMERLNTRVKTALNFLEEKFNNKGHNPWVLVNSKVKPLDQLEESEPNKQQIIALTSQYIFDTSLGDISAETVVHTLKHLLSLDTIIIKLSQNDHENKDSKQSLFAKLVLDRALSERWYHKREGSTAVNNLDIPIKFLIGIANLYLNAHNLLKKPTDFGKVLEKTVNNSAQISRFLDSIQCLGDVETTILNLIFDHADIFNINVNEDSPLENIKAGILMYYQKCLSNTIQARYFDEFIVKIDNEDAIFQSKKGHITLPLTTLLQRGFNKKMGTELLNPHNNITQKDDSTLNVQGIFNFLKSVKADFGMDVLKRLFLVRCDERDKHEYYSKLFNEGNIDKLSNIYGNKLTPHRLRAIILTHLNNVQLCDYWKMVYKENNTIVKLAPLMLAISTHNNEVSIQLSNINKSSKSMSSDNNHFKAPQPLSYLFNKNKEHDCLYLAIIMNNKTFCEILISKFKNIFLFQNQTLCIRYLTACIHYNHHDLFTYLYNEFTLDYNIACHAKPHQSKIRKFQQVIVSLFKLLIRTGYNEHSKPFIDRVFPTAFTLNLTSFRIPRFLHELVKSEEIATATHYISYFAKHRFNLDAKAHNNSSTPLMIASQLGKIELVKTLLHYGANLEAKDKDGETALFYACRNNQESICYLLSTVGSNLYVTNKFWQKAWDISEHFKPLKTITRILSPDYSDQNFQQLRKSIDKFKYVNINMIKLQTGESLITYAAKRNRSQLLHHLLYVKEILPLPNELKDLQFCDSILMKCFFKMENKYISYFKKNKLRLDIIVDINGATPLMIASQQGKVELVKTLLHYGANLEAKDKDGNTALMYACRNNQNKVCYLLSQKNADLYVSNKSGEHVWDLLDHLKPLQAINKIITQQSLAYSQQQMIDAIDSLAKWIDITFMKLQTKETLLIFAVNNNKILLVENLLFVRKIKLLAKDILNINYSNITIMKLFFDERTNALDLGLARRLVTKILIHRNLIKTVTYHNDRGAEMLSFLLENGLESKYSQIYTSSSRSIANSYRMLSICMRSQNETRSRNLFHNIKSDNTIDEFGPIALNHYMELIACATENMTDSEKISKWIYDERERKSHHVTRFFYEMSSFDEPAELWTDGVFSNPFHYVLLNGTNTNLLRYMVASGADLTKKSLPDASSFEIDPPVANISGSKNAYELLQYMKNSEFRAIIRINFHMFRLCTEGQDEEAWGYFVLNKESIFSGVKYDGKPILIHALENQKKKLYKAMRNQYKSYQDFYFETLDEDINYLRQIYYKPSVIFITAPQYFNREFLSKCLNMLTAQDFLEIIKPKLSNDFPFPLPDGQNIFHVLSSLSENDSIKNQVVFLVKSITEQLENQAESLRNRIFRFSKSAIVNGSDNDNKSLALDNLQQKDFFGRTPLHYAASSNNEKLVALFINMGLDITALDYSDKSAKDLALDNNHCQIATKITNTNKIIQDDFKSANQVGFINEFNQMISNNIIYSGVIWKTNKRNHIQLGSEQNSLHNDNGSRSMIHLAILSKNLVLFKQLYHKIGPNPAREEIFIYNSNNSIKSIDLLNYALYHANLDVVFFLLDLTLDCDKPIFFSIKPTHTPRDSLVEQLHKNYTNVCYFAVKMESVKLLTYFIENNFPFPSFKDLDCLIKRMGKSSNIYKVINVIISVKKAILDKNLCDRKTVNSIQQYIQRQPVFLCCDFYKERSPAPEEFCSLITIAIKQKKINTFKLLVKNKFKINKSYYDNDNQKRISYHVFLLKQAAEAGATKCLKYILTLCTPGLETQYNCLVKIALNETHIDAASLLIQHGYTLKIKTNTEFISFFKKNLKANKVEILDFLALLTKDQFEIPSSYSRYATKATFVKSKQFGVEFIIDRHFYGSSLLKFAISENKPTFVKKLIELGADTNSIDTKGKNAFQFALSKQCKCNKAIIQLLTPSTTSKRKRIDSTSANQLPSSSTTANKRRCLNTSMSANTIGQSQSSIQESELNTTTERVTNQGFWTNGNNARITDPDVDNNTENDRIEADIAEYFGRFDDEPKPEW